MVSTASIIETGDQLARFVAGDRSDIGVEADGDAGGAASSAARLMIGKLDPDQTVVELVAGGLARRR